MAADVQQNNFLFCDEKREGNPVAVSEADGMATGKLAAQWMKSKERLERVVLQIGNYSGEVWFEVGMLFEEFAGLAQKLLRSGNDVHYLRLFRFERFQQLISGLELFHPARLDILQ